MEDAKKLRWQHLPIWKSGFPSLIILLVTNLSFKLLPINLASSTDYLCASHKVYLYYRFDSF